MGDVLQLDCNTEGEWVGARSLRSERVKECEHDKPKQGPQPLPTIARRGDHETIATAFH
jgi:hypothetical protein